jgi:Rrf2 family nitric oxide-sensitive transcriptional repressor
MRLTDFSDYAFRMLMYAAQQSDRLITIEETAAVYGISRAHLTKVANRLTRAGYLTAVRGRSGGLALAKRPDKIRLGEVLRLTEPDFALVECFTPDNRCILSPRCRLRGALKEALASFTKTLDGYTLADLMRNPGRIGSAA